MVKFLEVWCVRYVRLCLLKWETLHKTRYVAWWASLGFGGTVFGCVSLLCLLDKNNPWDCQVLCGSQSKKIVCTQSVVNNKDLYPIHARSDAGLVVLVPLVAMSSSKMWPLGSSLQGETTSVHSCLNPRVTYISSAHSSLDRTSHVAPTSLHWRLQKVRNLLGTWWVWIFFAITHLPFQYGPLVGGNFFWFFLLSPVTGKDLAHNRGLESIWWITALQWMNK